MDFGTTVQLRKHYRKSQLDAHEQAIDYERKLRKLGALSLIKEMQNEEAAK
jgi:hypothetical protein